VAKLGWSWFWSRNASQDLRVAQEEVEQRRRAAAEYEVRIADAQIQLAKMNDKVFELVRIWSLEAACSALMHRLGKLQTRSGADVDGYYDTVRQHTQPDRGVLAHGPFRQTSHAKEQERW
jgi:hypothetical protein